MQKGDMYINYKYMCEVSSQYKPDPPILYKNFNAVVSIIHAAMSTNIISYDYNVYICG